MINDNVVNAFIQVSLTSTRLPNKALLDINGKKTIERVINNLNKSIYIDHVIIAFTDNEVDDPLETWAIQNKVLYKRGDYNNIIKRYLSALEEFPCNYIVRATGDSPVVNAELTDYLIKNHDLRDVDYSKFENNKLPIGISTEVFNSQALRKLFKFDLNFDYSEYMTYYFINNAHIFSILEVDPPVEFVFPDYRLTLDYDEDFQVLTKIFHGLESQKKDSTLRNIINYLKENPNIASINGNIPLIFKSDQKLIDKLNKVTKIN